MPNFLFIPDFKPGREDAPTPERFEAPNASDAEKYAYRKLNPGESGLLYKEVAKVSAPPTRSARA